MQNKNKEKKLIIFLRLKKQQKINLRTYVLIDTDQPFWSESKLKVVLPWCSENEIQEPEPNIKYKYIQSRWW